MTDDPKLDLFMRYGALRDLVEELLGSLPKCDLCKAPATKAHGRGGARYCDVHGGDDTPDYPRAKPIRRLDAFFFGTESKGGETA